MERFATPHIILIEARRRQFYAVGDLQSFRILIRASNWLGDSVISVLAVRAIKAGRPDAHITIAAPQKIAAIWRLVPEVDEIIAISNRRLFSTVRSLRRASPFDVAILFPNSLRVALEVWMAGIPRRVGYRGYFRRWLLNQIVAEASKVGPPQHQAFHYLRIAQEIGAESKETLSVQHLTFNTKINGPTQASNSPQDESVQTADIKHLSRRSDAQADQTSIGLCPGAEYGPAKRWLPERFAEVAKMIAEQHGIKWILFGTKKDAAIGEQICKTLGDSCMNRIGQTTIEELIDELRKCRVVLTNDTGTMHLASLIGLPVVAIFGSTEPRLTGPLGDGHFVLRHQVECSPCFLRQCPIDFRCMKAVRVEEVVEAVSTILAKSTLPSRAPIRS